MTCLLLGLLACAAAVAEDDTVRGLDETDPKLPPVTSRLSTNEMDQVDKIGSLKEMMRKIAEETEAPIKKLEEEEEGDGTAVEADIQQEQVAIGNTLRTMEAKEAVKQELRAETPVDCEMGVWSSYSKCSRRCGGGKKSKSRGVVRQAAHGGKKCGVLSKTIRCNTESCATEEAEEYEKSRELTEAEHKAETAVNNQHAKDIMASEDVDEMISGIKTLMRNMVKTDTVVIKAPGSLPGADPAKYELKQALKDAISKNSVKAAMANVPNTQDPTQAEIEAAGDGGVEP